MSVMIMIRKMMMKLKKKKMLRRLELQMFKNWKMIRQTNIIDYITFLLELKLISGLEKKRLNIS